MAFAGLAYPIWTAGNFLFVLYWILFKKRWFLLSTGILLIGIPFHSGFFRIDSSSGELSKAGDPLKVMSFNVRLFGLYKWGSNKETRDRIFRFLESEQPDIACFQEYFYSREKGYFDTKAPLRERLDADRVHQAFAHSGGEKHFFGIATFSKNPIIEKGRIEFPEGQKNICIYSDLLVQGDTIRVYNAHLGSIRTRGDKLNSLKGWRSILGKLKNAFIRRAEQSERISSHMQDCPHPILLCVDMNDTPSSYAYQRFASFLEDSFIRSGSGFGRTYRGKMPNFRIDYIFHSRDFHSFDHQVRPEELSDHRPVQCKVQLKPDSLRQN
jgi:endonuclease/exonuclease/phosphatase family metal-dependent hydrolase